MLTDLEVRAIAQTIVDKAKRTARVDQGSLRKSIAFTFVKGEVIFRELFYGQWNENSQLEKYANQLMPNGTRWKIIYTMLGGDTYEVGRTKSGRAVQKKSLSAVNRVGSSKAKALILRVNNGKKKDKGATESGQDN